MNASLTLIVLKPFSAWNTLISFGLGLLYWLVFSIHFFFSLVATTTISLGAIFEGSSDVLLWEYVNQLSSGWREPLTALLLPLPLSLSLLVFNEISSLPRGISSVAEGLAGVALPLKFGGDAKHQQ